MKPKPIRITIKASDGGADAPTVEDLLGQVGDLVKVLEGVEEAIAGDDETALIWRVTDATRNSPLTFEITPFPRNPAMNIDQRAFHVERATVGGLTALRTGGPRPQYFTEKVMKPARALHARLRNGLAETVIDADNAIISAPLVLNRATAEEVEKSERTTADAESIHYREIGSIEGFIARVELDGRHRAVLSLRARINGAIVKAFAKGQAFQQLERVRLGQVWGGARIRVFGLLHFRRLGVLDHVDANNVEFLDLESLPSLDDIIDPTFAEGLTTEEFLASRRND